MSEELIKALSDFCSASEVATAKLKHSLQQLEKHRSNPQLFNKLNLPDELKSLLNTEAKENMLILKPKRYLGAENFAKIMEALKPYEGKYVSEGEKQPFSHTNRKSPEC
ncbi:MAG: hypothetical protein QXL77_07415 [Candidatus Bathyarchaeia archaeon]